MPKEITYGRDLHELGFKGHEVVEVGWSRGNPAISVGSVTKHAAGGVAKEQHTTIKRREDVNTLIRALRKARDQAFGADA